MIHGICEHAEHKGQPGRFRCSSCDYFIWGKEQKYLVPSINPSIWKDGQKRRVIQRAIDERLSSQFDKLFLIRTRLNANLDFIVDDVVFPNPKLKKNRDEKLKKLKEKLLPFGLQVSRISGESQIEKNDPLIIHRIDVDPFQAVFDNPITGAIRPSIQKSLVEDKRWNDWAKIKQMNETFHNPFVNPLYPLQLKTLEKVLRYPGSLTIAALPTGFGKSRIAQVASYILRKNHICAENDNNNIWSKEDGDCGPTLIISPLVALMDDQRNKWEKDFNALLSQNGLDPLRCRFLTSADLLKDSRKMEELRNNELDVLCCSPEDLMDPKRDRNHWLETFARMKVPFSMMVVDEAHIIGSWGATIRPQFQLLSLVKDRLLQRNPNLRVLLMSATISMSEEEELIRLFSDGLHHKKFSRKESTAIRKTQNASRPELYFDISYDKEPNPGQLITKLQSINEELKEHWNKQANTRTPFRKDGRPSPILIYTPYPKIADEILRPSAQEIISEGVKGLVKTYTGQTSPLSREARLDEFIQNKIHAMIATSAFGMGVDKPDTWVVAYYGMPYSLSDLYQGFGRAARNADWNVQGYRKSGYCVGLLYGTIRSFKPRMGLALTTERFWDMLSSKESYFTENGYIVLDISENIEQKYWDTIVREHGIIQNRNEDEESDDEDDDYEGQINDMVQEIISNASLSIGEMKNSTVEEDFNRIFKENYSRMKKIKELLSLRLWAIACLQRVGKVELMGFHPELLFSENGDYVKLREVLQKDGYDGVVKAMIHQGENKLKTPKVRRMVVLRANQDINSFEDIVIGIKEGLSVLKNRHDRGRDELKEFIDLAKNPKAKGCFRQLFSKTIGLSDEKSCIEQIKTNLRLKNEEIVMPCSRCRNDQFFIERELDKDVMMVSKFKVLKVIRDGVKYDGNQINKPAYKKALIINRIERICSSTEYLLDGQYKIENKAEFNEFSIINQETREMLGSVIVSNGVAEITSENYGSWENNQYIVAEKGSNKAYLTDHVM